MSIDAVALFRPKNADALRRYLDLDEESEESRGLYCEPLEDGAFLVHTFQPYFAFETNPMHGGVWMGQFGADLPLVHDDPRGMLFFPDICEPSARTYEAVVAEIASAGLWIPVEALSAEMAQANEPNARAAMSPGDLQGLPAIAEQMLASLNVGAIDLNGDMGSVIAALQQQIMGALGGPGGAFASMANASGDEFGDEFGDDEDGSLDEDEALDDDEAPDDDGTPQDPAPGA